jgi:Predicted NTPase (NACHT family)
MKVIRDSEIQEALLGFIKPTSYSGQNFPFTDLNDRSFEILLYQIFKNRIEFQDNTVNDLFDSVALMQGVGEQGRDSVLLKCGRNVGLIQCKQINKNLTKPEIIKEITKFCINSIIDKSLVFDRGNFIYYLAVSKGLAGTSIDLLNDFNRLIFEEQNLKSIVIDTLNSFAKFKGYAYDAIEPELHDIFRRIKVKYILPADLTQYLFDYEHLIKNFFRVLTVTDNSLLEQIINNYLAPTLKKLYPERNKEYKDFTFRFKEYLERSYNRYTSSKTLIFGNQQKKLEDFYYPLTLICKCDKLKEDERLFSTLKYEEDFVPHYKKVLIVDNGGMGKSTVMKWLFLSVLKQKKGIPIFIELRKLKRDNNIISEIINELKPIDDTIEYDIISKLIAQGNFIFFLDGYDEISEENRSIVTTDLQDFISKASNNLFIITSRPETALNTFSEFQEFNIKKLGINEAFDLIKKIGENSEKSLRLIRKIKEDKLMKINEFLQSPLLVSLLYRKFDYRETIPLKLQEFYYEVFEALFQAHDLTKGDSYIRDKKTKLSLSDFFQVLRELGFYTMRVNELEYNHSTLSKYLDEISYRLPNIKFKSCDFIDDIVKVVPLFNREGLTFRWSHKSFQEYFAAEFICRDTKEKQIEVMQKMYRSPRSEKFHLIFSLCYDIDYKVFMKAVLHPVLKEFIEYYDNSYIEFESIIDNKLIIKRKELTFNSFYIIAFDKTDVLKLPFKISPTLEESDILGSEITKLIPEGYRLRQIMLSNTIFFITTKKGFSIETLLKEKNSDLIKAYDKDEISFRDFKDPELKGIIVIDENRQNILNSIHNFDNTSNLIAVHGDKLHFDYNKCCDFVRKYEYEQTLEREEYFFSGL